MAPCSLPHPPHPASHTRTTDTSTMDRYLWTVQWFAANGMYVLIDYHPMGLEWVQVRPGFMAGMQTGGHRARGAAFAQG